MSSTTKRAKPKSEKRIRQDQRRNTILAGLRCLQIAYDAQKGLPESIITILIDGGTKQLNHYEIDDLCDEIGHAVDVIKL